MRILIVGIDVFNLSKIRQPYNIYPRELSKALANAGNEVMVITNGEQTTKYRTNGIEVRVINARTYHFLLMLGKKLKAEARNADAVCAFIPIIFAHRFPSLRPPSKPPVVNTVFTDKLEFGDFFSTSRLWLADISEPTFKGYSPYIWARLFYPNVTLKSILRANRIDQLVVTTEYMKRRISL
jgi:hypothetical protein